MHKWTSWLSCYEAGFVLITLSINSESDSYFIASLLMHLIILAGGGVVGWGVYTYTPLLKCCHLKKIHEIYISFVFLSRSVSFSMFTIIMNYVICHMNMVVNYDISDYIFLLLLYRICNKY